MKKRFVITAAAVVLAFLMSLFASMPMTFIGETKLDWMAELDDDLPLRSLSVPGTHDSGALYSIADICAKCQTLTVEDQLKIGVRAFDIRLALVGDELRVMHNIVDQLSDLDDVLDAMIGFLKAHPSEFLLVSFKEENPPKNSDLVFADALEARLLEYDEVCKSTSLCETVGDARGKLCVLARYDGSIGISLHESWKDNTAFVVDDANYSIYVQDFYRITDTEDKKSDIEAAFEVSERCEHSLVINFTSCYFSSGIPITADTALDINPWLIDTIPTGNGPLGVLLCDFMTHELANVIIERNFQ